jgi:hypothetical protein
MKNVALFISGRVIGFKECLLPLINNIQKKYNLFLFFSINTFSLNKMNENEESIINDLKNTFNKKIGGIYIGEYKFPKSYVENRINNNIYDFSYNCLSCFYNDSINIEVIKLFEKNNNIEFDLICKIRSDIFFNNNDIDFIFDNKEDFIIRNKHICDIRYWGHFYHDTPMLISDAFAYGNKISMKKYCSTYEWILKNDLLLKGTYTQAFEVFLTDSILEHVFFNVVGGEYIPTLSKEEIINKYINNPSGVTIIYLNNVKYNMLPSEIRSKNNFIVNKDNVLNYTDI